MAYLLSGQMGSHLYDGFLSHNLLNEPIFLLELDLECLALHLVESDVFP